MPHHKLRKPRSIDDEILEILIDSCSKSETGFVHESQILKTLKARRSSIGKEGTVEMICETLEQLSSEGLCLEGSSRWWRPVKSGSEEQKALKSSFNRKPRRSGNPKNEIGAEQRRQTPPKAESDEENVTQNVHETQQSPASVSAALTKTPHPPKKVGEQKVSVVNSKSESRTSLKTVTHEERPTTTKKIDHDRPSGNKTNRTSSDESCIVDSILRYSMGAQMLVHVRRKKTSTDLDDDNYRLEYEGFANLQKIPLEVE